MSGCYAMTGDIYEQVAFRSFNYNIHSWSAMRRSRGTLCISSLGIT